jgi:hypothetical protein
MNKKFDRIVKLLTTLSMCLFVALGFPHFSESAEIEPEVILIGSPTKLTPEMRQKLPTGYRWVTKEQVEPIYWELTGDMEKDVKALQEIPQVFAIFDENLDMEEVMQFARKNGKTEIYLKTQNTNPENMVPLSIDDAYDLLLKTLRTTITGIEWIIDPFIIKDALADTVPGVGSCSTGTHYSFPACFPTAAGASTLEYCFTYSGYTCHFHPWILHSNWNIDSYIDNGANVNNNTWVSMRTAIGYMGTPLQPASDLEIWNYPSNTNFEFVYRCGVGNAACAQCPNCGNPSKPSPRPHEGKIIYTADNTTRNNWAVIRHELAHNYNYEHCEIDLDFDNIARSINSYGQGTTVSKPVGGCASIGRNDCRHNSSICSAPGVLEFPNNIYY